MQNLIFFDIDGTLVGEGDFLPDSAVYAIRRARQKGNLVMINTGRTAMNVDGFLRDIGFDGYIYGCGTQMEYAGQTLFHVIQTPERTLEMVELVRRTGAGVLYECSDAIYYDEQSRMLPGLRDLLEHYAKKDTAFYPVPAAPWQMDKFVIWYDDQTDLAAFQAGIAGKFDFIDRGNGFSEMVPCGYSKATAMTQMMAQLGIPKERVYALGDSLNDAPMLEAAGTGIAMGQGTMLHPYADYITASLQEDGVLQALEQFGLC